MYEPGNYRATIVSQGLLKSAAKGTPFVRLMIRPTAKLVDGKPRPIDFAGEREIALYITEKTVDRLADTLIDLGYPYDTFDEIAPSHPQFHSFKGVELDCAMKTEQYNGKPQERWEIGGGQAEELDRKATSELNQFSGALKAKRKAAGGAPATKPPARPATKKPAPNNTTFTDADENEDADRI